MNKGNAYLVGISILLLCIFVVGIDAPFVGMHESASLTFSNFARMHVQHGFSNTRFAAISWDRENQRSVFNYVYHPVLIHVMLSVVYRLFGFADWVGRVFALSFAFGSLVFIYRIALLLWDNQTARFAVFFAGFFPMFLLFGKLISFITPTLFFILGAVFYYCRWHMSLLRRDFGLFIVFLVLAMLTGWPGYYLIPVLSLHAYFYARSSNEKLRMPVVILTTGGIVGILFVLYVFSLVGFASGWSTLVQKFSERALQANVAEISQYHLGQWLALMFVRAAVYFTPVALFLTLCYGGNLLVRRASGEKVSFAQSIIIVLFCIGAIHVTLFNQGAWDHNLWQYYFIPFFALSAGAILSGSLRRRESKVPRGLQTVLIVLFLVSSLPVIIYAKRIEKRNIQVYEIAKQVNAQLAPQSSMIAVTSRFFQSLLFRYYFNRDVAIIRDREALVNVLSRKNCRFRYVVRIMDRDYPDKSIEETGSWLTSRYPSKSFLNNSKCEVVLFYLNGRDSLQPVPDQFAEAPEASTALLLSGLDSVASSRANNSFVILAKSVYDWLLARLGAPEI